METLISILVTLLFSVLVTWFFARKQMEKNEIIHYSINSYDVGKGLHDEFPKFQLKYDNLVLSDEVQVLKGGFVNNGRKDISGLKNDSDVNIILPEGCSLKEIKINTLSKELKVTACANKDNPRIINFAIDEKFMSGEGFEYTAIIVTTKEIKNLHRKIDFKHRIPNTSSIKNEFIGQQTEESPIRFGGLALPGFGLKSARYILLLSSFLFGFISIVLFLTQKVQFNVIENDTKKEVSLYLTPQSQLYTSDNTVFPFYDKKIISKEELDKNYSITLNTIYSWKDSESSVGGIIFAIFAVTYLVCACFAYYLWNRKKHLYRLIEQYEKE